MCVCVCVIELVPISRDMTFTDPSPIHRPFDIRQLIRSDSD